MASTGYKTDPRAVTSVEGRTGAVDITPEDVGVADAVEEALGSQIGDAITEHVDDTDPHGDRAFTTSAVATHTGASDPHGDRSFATSAVSTHAGAADPHGDRSFATSAVSTHAGASDPHGDRSFATSAIATHAAATDPHGDRTYADGAITTAAAALVPTTRTITASTGLTGGGDLSTNRSFAVAYGITAGTAAQGNDARLSDARTPTAHQHAGADITSGTVPIGQLPTGTSGTTVALGNHLHTGTYANASHAHSGADITSGTVAIGQLPTGTGGSNVALGNHTHGVATGGTGLTNVTSGSYLVGNGTGALTQRTVAETQTDLSISLFGAWTGVGLVSNNLVEIVAAWSADVSGTYFDVGFRAAAGGKLEGSGRLNTTTNYTGGATIFTLPAALCPAKSLVLDVRIGGSGAAAAFLTITSGGVASLSASFTAGAGTWLQLDSIGSRRTVSGA